MKIYFAGADADYIVNPLLAVGVKYALTSYEKWRGTGVEKFNALPYNEFTSVIVDSGLYSYLWGKKSHIKYDKNFYHTYLDNYSKFIESSRFENMRYVELDVQEKLGVDFAWELREKLVERFGKNKIINVCHLVDGDPKQLITYADYLAIVPMPIIKKHGIEYLYNYLDYVYRVAETTNTKIHLFGVTRPNDVRLCYGATSCDSTTWFTKISFGNYSSSNYFYGKNNYLDIRSLGNLRSLLEEIETLKNVSLGRNDSERYRYYAAYTALLHYQSIDPNSVT